MDNLEHIIKDNTTNGILKIDDDTLKSLETEQIQQIVNHSDTPKLFLLPDFEIKFFEWLKEKDQKIWNDLWKNDDISEQPYIVSIYFFDKILKSIDRGFPICDLVDNDNYFFAPENVKSEQGKIYVEIAKKKLAASQRMTIEELLLLEISTEAIDIWHFAYKYNLDLDKIKIAVLELSDEGSLQHYKKSEEISLNIEF